MLFFIALSGGMAMRSTFEDEQLIWTPADNNSLRSRDKGSTLFPSKGGFVSMIAEVKDPSKDGASVITLAALEEVKKFTEELMATEGEVNGTTAKWTDICNKIGDDCFGLESILQFGYKSTPQQNGPPKKEWKLNENFASDAELLKAVQDGTKDSQVVELSSIIGGTTPETITQDLENGTNDVKSAKAMMLGYPYLLGNFTAQQLEPIEEEMEKKAAKFSESSEHVNIFMFTQYGLR